MKKNLNLAVTLIPIILSQNTGAATANTQCLLEESDVAKILCLQKLNTGGVPGPNYNGPIVFNHPPELEQYTFGPKYPDDVK